ncbi:unnamed protein product [Lathyrus oleraceus]
MLARKSLQNGGEKAKKKTSRLKAGRGRSCIFALELCCFFLYTVVILDALCCVYSVYVLYLFPCIISVYHFRFCK